MASTTQPIAVGPQGRVRELAWPRVRYDLMLALMVLLCAGLLACAQMLVLTYRGNALSIGANSREGRVLFAGFHSPERDARGRYRWTTGASSVTFPQIGSGPTGLHLRLGPPPLTLPSPRLTISYGAGSATTITTNDQPRLYRFLVPADAAHLGRLTVQLGSDTTTVAGDPRTVGLRVEGVELRSYGRALVWPGPLLLGSQLVLLALLGLLLRPLGIKLPLSAGLLVGAALFLAGVSVIQMLLILPYIERLLAAAALLVALTYGLLPFLVRRLAPLFAPTGVRALWGVTLLAVLVRLTGALFPAFAAHDLPLNVGRLLTTVGGDLLVTNRSFEFGGGVTVYPPGPYVALQPGLLLGLPPSLLVAGGIALIDGLGAFGIGLLARTLGLSRRGALLAALLYAGTPVGLMALFFGHTAQAFGQAMMVPLLLLLLHALARPTEARRWLLAALPLAVALLSHIGVTILAVAWLGLGWLALLLWRRTSWRATLSLGGVVAACALLALVLIYGLVLGTHLEQTQEIGAEALEEGFAPATWLIWRGFLVAFGGLGLLLAPFGLLLLARRPLPLGARELVGAWLAAAACFLAVELVTGLQVRYIYFLAPIISLALALTIDRMAAYGPSGRLTASAATLLLFLGGCITWYGGVLLAERVSMVAVLR